MSALEDAKSEVARLEEQARLEKKFHAAGEALGKNDTEKTRAAHNKAAEALADFRTANRMGGRTTVGGDAFIESSE